MHRCSAVQCSAEPQPVNQPASPNIVSTPQFAYTFSKVGSLTHSLTHHRDLPYTQAANGTHRPLLTWTCRACWIGSVRRMEESPGEKKKQRQNREKEKKKRKKKMCWDSLASLARACVCARSCAADPNQGKVPRSQPVDWLEYNVVKVW